MIKKDHLDKDAKDFQEISKDVSDIQKRIKALQKRDKMPGPMHVFKITVSVRFAGQWYNHIVCKTFRAKDRKDSLTKGALLYKKLGDSLAKQGTITRESYTIFPVRMYPGYWNEPDK